MIFFPSFIMSQPLNIIGISGVAELLVALVDWTKKMQGILSGLKRL